MLTPILLTAAGGLFVPGAFIWSQCAQKSLRRTCQNTSLLKLSGAGGGLDMEPFRIFLASYCPPVSFIGRVALWLYYLTHKKQKGACAGFEARECAAQAHNPPTDDRALNPTHYQQQGPK